MTTFGMKKKGVWYFWFPLSFSFIFWYKGLLINLKLLLRYFIATKGIILLVHILMTDEDMKT